MAQSWRTETNEKDTTEITTTSTNIVGAMVIEAPKGKNDFVFFNKGETQKVINMFGYPNEDYPSIQDAIDIVKKSSMWLARPYKESKGTYGGVFVTKNGTVPFVNGVKEKSLDDESLQDLSKVPCSILLEEKTDGNNNKYYVGEVLNYTRLSNDDDDKPIVKIGETEIELHKDGTTYTGSDDTNTITVYLSGSQDNEGKIIINNPDGSVDINTSVEFDYAIDVSDTYFILFNQNEQTDDLKVKVTTTNLNDEGFSINVYRYDEMLEDYDEISASPYVVGLTKNMKDSYGRNIFIGNVLSEKAQYLFTALVVDDVFTTFNGDSSLVALRGGSYMDLEDTDDGLFTDLYNKLTNTNKYQIKFVCDPGLASKFGKSIITAFNTLRGVNQKRCRFLYCTQDVSVESILNGETKPVEYAYGISDNRGMYCYCLNWGIHADAYNNNDFNCSNMGLICGKLVDVLENGGGVPAWIDEDGVGGILGSGDIVSLNQNDFTEDQLEELDDLNFNPIVDDYTYGPMISGWKTRQVRPTVYSYIGQSSLADTIIELIEKNVMPQRVAKLIDETSYSAVRSGCNDVLTQYANFLEDYYVWCDNKLNTDDTRNEQKLLLKVGVVFKGYAQRVILTFTAYKNGVDVQETMENV